MFGVVMACYNLMTYCCGIPAGCRSNNSIKEKLLYAMSPTAYLMKREQNAVYISSPEYQAFLRHRNDESLTKSNSTSSIIKEHKTSFNLFDDLRKN